MYVARIIEMFFKHGHLTTLSQYVDRVRKKNSYDSRYLDKKNPCIQIKIKSFLIIVKRTAEGALTYSTFGQSLHNLHLENKDILRTKEKYKINQSYLTVVFNETRGVLCLKYMTSHSIVSCHLVVTKVQFHAYIVRRKKEQHQFSTSTTLSNLRSRRT